MPKGYISYIGNMGYPVITRLGISQFWYKHWYSDTSYYQNSKQDKIFIELMKIYLNYGLTYNNNIFFNEYFFTKSKRKIRTNFLNENSSKFYRRYFYQNLTVGIEHSYLLRNRTGEYFPLRLWLLKYNTWIILCFNCFKPIKKKKTKPKAVLREVHSLNPDLSYNKRLINFNRIKLVFLYIKKCVVKKVNYCF